MDPPYCHNSLGKQKQKQKPTALCAGMRKEGGELSGKSGLLRGRTNNHRLEKYSGGEMWARQIPPRAEGHFPWHSINYVTVASLNFSISCCK